jgi:hypothetical protein
MELPAPSAQAGEVDVGNQKHHYYNYQGSQNKQPHWQRFAGLRTIPVSGTQNSTPVACPTLIKTDAGQCSQKRFKNITRIAIVNACGFTFGTGLHLKIALYSKIVSILDARSQTR